uniref:Uncharacterized protein n=1 Tax=Anguilla anguilla TaxID=7936 RepID=A0A0E9UW37_ANGAN
MLNQHDSFVEIKTEENASKQNEEHVFGLKQTSCYTTFSGSTAVHCGSGTDQDVQSASCISQI